MAIEITGKITRNGVTTEFSIDPSTSSEGGWEQWGGTTEQLGPNVNLLDAITEAARESDEVRGCSCGEADYGAEGHEGYDEEDEEETTDVWRKHP